MKWSIACSKLGTRGKARSNDRKPIGHLIVFSFFLSLSARLPDVFHIGTLLINWRKLTKKAAAFLNCLQKCWFCWILLRVNSAVLIKQKIASCSARRRSRRYFRGWSNSIRWNVNYIMRATCRDARNTHYRSLSLFMGDKGWFFELVSGAKRNDMFRKETSGDFFSRTLSDNSCCSSNSRPSDIEYATEAEKKLTDFWPTINMVQMLVLNAAAAEERVARYILNIIIYCACLRSHDYESRVRTSGNPATDAKIRGRTDRTGWVCKDYEVAIFCEQNRLRACARLFFRCRFMVCSSQWSDGEMIGQEKMTGLCICNWQRNDPRIPLLIRNIILKGNSPPKGHLCETACVAAWE